VKKTYLIILILLACCFAGTKLGSWYIVKRDHTQYVAAEGDKSIKELDKGMIVRLIKDDSVAETVVLIPVRIIKLMFTYKPRGNWLVEDKQGNRGYVWAHELELTD